jgi:hypothetical protein
MLSEGRKTPLQFWQTTGSSWPNPQPIAIRMFHMETSSDSAERNFSIMGFIHLKLRNRLCTTKVEKLVFLKSNLQAFYEYPKAIEDDVDLESTLRQMLTIGRAKSSQLSEDRKK